MRRTRLAAFIAPLALLAAPSAAPAADSAVCTWKVRVEFDRGLSMTPSSGAFRTATPGVFGCAGNAARHTFAPRPGTIELRGSYASSTCLAASGRGTFRIVVPRFNLSQNPTHTTLTGGFSLSGPPLTGYHSGRARPHGGDGRDMFFGGHLLGELDPRQDCFTRAVTAATIYGTTTITGPMLWSRARVRPRARRAG